MAHTLVCGQCFRWSQEQDGRWVGIAGSKAAVVYEEGENICIEAEGSLAFWKNYFDLGREYARIIPSLGSHPFTLAAIEFAQGLRVLRQEPWETICTFIFSQRNNIPRITSLVANLSRLAGPEIEFEGKIFYAFPSPEKVLSMSEKSLEALRAGYRAKYLQNAAKAVLEGRLDFKEIAKLPRIPAREKLMEINGIGPKVADCVLLFGFGKTDAFPVDTWIKRAAEYYGGSIDQESFGDHSGIAQQFIFHYVRHLGKSR